MMTSDFRPEGEIWQSRACTMKIMHYKLLIDEWTKFPCPVAFVLTTKGLIVTDPAMGQIPRFTERTVFPVLLGFRSRASENVALRAMYV